MSFLVATNVVASRPPERRPTGTPHARAKSQLHVNKISLTVFGNGLLPYDMILYQESFIKSVLLQLHVR